MQARIQQRSSLAIEDDPRWRAVIDRDAAADGQFYYSVKTTGVYCFPSCAARPPKPENVSFHSTREDAERAGFRPCKRCQPDRGDAKQRQTTDSIRYALGQSALGTVLVARTERGLCALLLGEGDDELRQDLERRFPNSSLKEDNATLEPLLAQVTAYLASPKHDLEVELDLRGTEFQQKVWRALREIPSGATASYTELARRIDQPRAVRAVAQACAANHIAVVIPCHRVVRSDGNLSGYRWGVDRKRALLQTEGAA